MNTAKKYHDSEGNVCSIWEAVRREPDWAANIIQGYEKTTEALQEEVERLRGVITTTRELLSHQDKGCLGTGHALDTQPWPIVDELIDTLSNALATTNKG